MRLIRRLFVILCLCATAFLVWAGIYTRKQGFTKSWRAAIEREFNKRGYHVEIGKITLGAFRGLVAEDVRFFQSEERLQELAFIDDVFLDVDLSQILDSKTLSIKTLDVEKAKLSLPLDPLAPDSPRLDINNLSGRIVVTESLIEIIRAEAEIAGVDIRAKGTLLRPPAHQLVEKPEKPKLDEKAKPELSPEDQEQLERLAAQRQQLHSIISHISRLEFPVRSPILEIEFRGDLRDLTTTNAQVRIDSDRIRNKDQPYEISALQAELELFGEEERIELKEFALQDEKGKIELEANWNKQSKSISFRGKSDADILRLIHSIHPIPQAAEYVLFQPPHLDVEGHIDLAMLEKKNSETLDVGESSADEVGEAEEEDEELSEGARDVRKVISTFFPGEVMGDIRIARFVSRGTVFNSLHCDFNLSEDRVYLRNLRLEHKTGVAFLNVKHEPGNGEESFQFQTVVELDPMVFRPFFNKKGRKFLDSWNFDESSSIYLAAAGQGQDLEMKEWSSKGEIKLQNFRLNSVRFEGMETNFETNKENQYYRNVSMTRSEGKIVAEMAHFHLPSREWKLKGAVSTTDVVEGARAFSPKLAESLRKYQFSAAPTIRISGTLDGRRAEDVGSSVRNTDVNISFESPSPAKMQFLGKELNLVSPKGALKIVKSRVHLTSLDAGVFGGSMSLRYDSKNVRDPAKPYEASLVLRNVPLEEVTRLYGGTDKSKGLLSGTAQFSGRAGSLASLNGQGSATITNGDLFGIPVFGPLSKTITDASPNQDRAGYSIAREASGNFTIRGGVIYSSDFVALTKTFQLKADGWVNCNEGTVEVDVLLSPRDDLAKAIFSPITGLLAYEGTGKFNSPVWKPKALSGMGKVPGEVLKVPAQIVEGVAEVPLKGLQMIGKSLTGKKGGPSSNKPTSRENTSSPSSSDQPANSNPKGGKAGKALRKIFGGGSGTSKTKN